MEPFGIVLSLGIIGFSMTCLALLCVISIGRRWTLRREAAFQASLIDAHINGYNMGYRQGNLDGHCVGRNAGYTAGYRVGKHHGSFEGTVEQIITELENIANGKS